MFLTLCRDALQEALEEPETAGRLGVHALKSLSDLLEPHQSSLVFDDVHVIRQQLAKLAVLDGSIEFNVGQSGGFALECCACRE
jgi:hypothetical protein